MIASIHFSNVANFDSHYVLEPILLNGSSCCPTIKWISLIHVLGSSWVIKHLSISKLAGKHMRSSFACASASNIFVLLVEFLISELCSVDLAYSLASRVLRGHPLDTRISECTSDQSSLYMEKGSTMVFLVNRIWVYNTSEFWVWGVNVFWKCNLLIHELACFEQTSNVYSNGPVC